MRDRALLGEAAHHVDATITDAQVTILVRDGLRVRVPGAVGVPHGGAVLALRVLMESELNSREVMQSMLTGVYV